MICTSLFDWAVRATLLLAVALLLARLVERRSATTAHRLLTTASLCILIVLPISMTVASGWRWVIPIRRASESIELPINTQLDTNRTTNRAAPVAMSGETEGDSMLPPFEPAEIPNRPWMADSVDPTWQFAGERSGQALGESEAVASAPLTTPDDSTKLASTSLSAKWLRGIAITWGVVTGFLTLRFAFSVNRLRRAISSCQYASPTLSKQVHDLSRKCALKRPLQVLLSKPGSMPMACWLGRWALVVPEDFESWPEELREVTLIHELGHIARRDAWTDYLAQCVACVLWPNPIAWVAVADTRRLRERACDEWSLAKYSGDAKHYALSLIEVVRRCQQPESRVACAIGDKSGLESRLKWLFSYSPSQVSWALRGVPSIFLALSLVVAVTTAEQADSSRPEGPLGTMPESLPVAVSSIPSPKPPALSVSGSVKDEAGSPLPGASVVLRASFEGVQYAEGLQHARDVLARTTTNSQGEFEFSGIGLPPRLVGVIDGLHLRKPVVQVLAWAEGAGLQWKPVDSFDEAGMEFRLSSEVEVYGVASDESGNPLEGGELTVTAFTKATDKIDEFLRAPDDLHLLRSELRFTGAIRDGRFSLVNMPEDYRISIRLESRSGRRVFFVIDTGSGTSKEIITYRYAGRETVPVHRTPIRVTAKPQPWVQIKVVDDQGRPVAGGGVNAVRERRYGGSAAVGDDGIAMLFVNQPGVHKVRYGSDPINPALGIVQEIDVQSESRDIVEMRLPASRSLPGKVIDSGTGEPVPGVYVLGSKVDVGNAIPRVTGSLAVSGVDGRFELPVTEGDYKLVIRHQVDGYFVPTPAANRNTGPEPAYPTVTVTSENSLGEVVLKIARGLVVKGTVTDEQGLPARGIIVTASCEQPHYRQTATVTDAGGHYHFAGLSPYVPVHISARSELGTAEATIARAEDHPWDETLTKNVALRLVTRTREIENGQPITLPDAELKSPGQTLAGVVVDPDGSRLEGITVVAHRAPGLSMSVPQNGPQPWTKTDDKGRFQITHLPDEPIWLIAYETFPVDGRMLYPCRANPERNASNIRMVFDASLLEELEDLD